MSESIHKILHCIQTYLDTEFPKADTQLNPPATDADLAQLHDATGGNPPPDLVALYKHHNGASGCFMNSLEFLPISKSINEINALKEHLWVRNEDNVEYKADSGINPSDYSSDNVPAFLIGTDNSYNEFLCVEYMSDKAHVAHGRVIYIDFSADRFVKAANSIDDLLINFYDDLKQNRYYSDEELLWRDSF